MITPPAALEALLFAAGEPVSRKQASALLGLKEEQLSVAAKALSESLADRGLALIETDKELELRTTADAAPLVKKLREDELSRDLGKGSLETLAVIAYQDGATRAEIDWVRGVNSTASLKNLLLRGLVEGAEDPADKRRLRYTLTTDALAHLGLTSAADLPRAEELRPATEAALAEKETVSAEDAE